MELIHTVAGRLAALSRANDVRAGAIRAKEASGFLVGPTVFKTDEAASGRLAGSIPVRLRKSPWPAHSPCGCVEGRREPVTADSQLCSQDKTAASVNWSGVP